MDDISKYFFGYYGLDWLAMLASFVSIEMLKNKNKHGFVVAFLGSGCWLVFNGMAGSVAGVIANCLFSYEQIRAYSHWKIDEARQIVLS